MRDAGLCLINERLAEVGGACGLVAASQKKRRVDQEMKPPDDHMHPFRSVICPKA